MAKPLQSRLSNIMWKYCGVSKSKDFLEIGLKKVKEIKNLIPDVDVRFGYQNYDDLVQVFDLEASVFSAQATIISALQREESRGSHQRSDFPSLKKSENCNYQIKLNENSFDLEILKKNKKPLKKNLHETLKKVKRVSNFKNKLLE